VESITFPQIRFFAFVPQNQQFQTCYFEATTMSNSLENTAISLNNKGAYYLLDERYDEAIACLLSAVKTTYGRVRQVERDSTGHALAQGLNQQSSLKFEFCDPKSPDLPQHSSLSSSFVFTKAIVISDYDDTDDKTISFLSKIAIVAT
jgi:hypothetical protein